MTKRILHIEDEKDTQNRVKTLLENQCYKVITASTGREGLDRLSEDVDLVLLDLILPDMSGLEVFRWMKARFHRAKIAFLSKLSISDDEFSRLREEGVSDYITKPFNNEDLTRRVRHILELKRNILHIEDDEDTSNLVKLLLETRGYDVITASTGREGLDRLSEDVDLVLLDVMLPDMNGWMIFQEIRKDPGNRALKVAFLSIIPISDEQLTEFRRYGVLDYITKPFNNIDLIKRVDGIMVSGPVFPYRE